jgi:hypothetical protein
MLIKTTNGSPILNKYKTTTAEEVTKERGEINLDSKDILVLAHLLNNKIAAFTRRVLDNPFQREVNRTISPLLLSKVKNLSKEVADWADQTKSIREILMDINKGQDIVGRNHSMRLLEYDSIQTQGYFDILSYLHNLHPQQCLYMLEEVFKLGTSAAERQRYTPYTDKEEYLIQSYEITTEPYRTPKDELEFKDIADIINRFFVTYVEEKTANKNVERSQREENGTVKGYSWLVTDKETKEQAVYAVNDRDTIGVFISEMNMSTLDSQNINVKGWRAERIHQQMLILTDIKISFNHLFK